MLGIVQRLCPGSTYQ